MNFSIITEYKRLKTCLFIEVTISLIDKIISVTNNFFHRKILNIKSMLFLNPNSDFVFKRTFPLKSFFEAFLKFFCGVFADIQNFRFFQLKLIEKKLKKFRQKV